MAKRGSWKKRGREYVAGEKRGSELKERAQLSGARPFTKTNNQTNREAHRNRTNCLLVRRIVSVSWNDYSGLSVTVERNHVGYRDGSERFLFERHG